MDSKTNIIQLIMYSITTRTNKYIITNNTMRFIDFDEPLEPYRKTMCQFNITDLNMGDVFDFPFDFGTNTMRNKIKALFGRRVSVPNIKRLTFGNWFNQPIDLTQYLIGLTVLTFGRQFDQPIVLTPNIEVLIFGENFDQPIILTPNVKILTFGWSFNQPIILTSNVQVLQFECRYNRPIVLTKCIIVLTFGYHFNKPIVLTKYLRILTFGERFSQPIVLTRSIMKLTLGAYFNQPIVLTKNIRVISFGRFFNKPVSLTKNIKILTLEECFNQPICLNKQLREVIFNCKYHDRQIILTPCVTRLTIRHPNYTIVDNLSNDIEYIILDKRFTFCLKNIPPSVKCIERHALL